MKPFKFSSVAAGILTAAALFFSGCGGNKGAEPQQEAKAALPAAKPATAPATTAVEQVKIEYRYDPFNKPDPFESIIPNILEGPQLNPLLSRDLSEFRLKGVIWNIKSPYAMVEDPTGRGYIVKLGSRIGRNNGEIISITRGEIVVLELRRNPLNPSGPPISSNKVSIKLPDNKK